MKKILIIFLLLICPISVFAAIVDIYCPKCHKFLWTLNYENPLTTDDFNEKNIVKGEYSKRLICPFDGAPVNGWEYWAYERDMHPPVMVYPALTVMTKNMDKDYLILCRNYPYKEGQIIPDDILFAYGRIFNPEPGDIVTSRKVNEFCEQGEFIWFPHEVNVSNN